MAFSARERILLLATGVVVGVLVLERFVFTPVWNHWTDLQAQEAVLANRRSAAENLLARRERVEPRWRHLLGTRLKRDPAEAESQVLHALGTWAADARLNVVSVRPERTTAPDQTPLPTIAFQAAGTGSLAAVARFLWHLETAEIPIRVETVQLTSRRDGQDDLSLQIKLTTLYAPGGGGPGDRQAEAPRPSEGGTP